MRAVREILSDKYVEIHEGFMESLRKVEALEGYANNEITLRDVLIEVLDEYIELLGSELDSVVLMASVHGWKSTRHDKGVQLREKIANLKELIKES